MKLENIIQESIFTPKKVINSEMQTTQKILEKCVKLPGDAESVVMNALMEKVRYSRINESFSRSRSPFQTPGESKRAPSSELKQCLRSRGFVIEGDKPVYKK